MSESVKPTPPPAPELWAEAAKIAGYGDNARAWLQEVVNREANKLVHGQVLIEKYDPADLASRLANLRAHCIEQYANVIARDHKCLPIDAMAIAKTTVLAIEEGNTEKPEAKPKIEVVSR